MKPLHELDALCAEKVAGCVPCDNWKPYMHDSQMRIDDSCGHANCVPRSMWPPKYSENPAAVLGLLEKEHCVSCGRCYQKGPNGMVCDALPLIWYVDIGETDEDAGKTPHTGMAPTFARAATLALLKAHGVETGGDTCPRHLPYGQGSPPVSCRCAGEGAGSDAAGHSRRCSLVL